MSKKSILNKEGQKHYYSDLVTIMQDLNPNEVNDVLYALGLDELVDPNGGLAPYLSADIVSSEERFLNPAVQHNITLTGKLYNFFREDSERAESWRWTRDSGNPTEDAAWFRDTKEIVITDADLTDSVRKGKVFFTLSVKVGDEYFTDVIDFSTVISLNSVQIQASHSLFLGGTPSEISLQANVSEGIYAESYKWYVNDVLKAATRTYKLPSSIIENGKVANIRLEVLDGRGKLYTDFISIPKISNGTQGEPGTPGANGQNGAPGVPGSRGPMPRMLEWRENYTYYRSAEYRDYVYFRSSNTTYEGWYCVKDIPINLYNTTPDGVKEYRARGNAGSPDTAIFQKQDFVDSQVFGTIIAENANLAGFIFKDERLVSQTQVGSVPKIILNGKTGYASFISAEISDSRLEEVEIESATIENALISNTTFKNGKIEMFSDVVPSNANKVALSSEVKINAGGYAKPTFTFFNNTGDERENWETSRSMVQIVGSIYRDGVLFVLPGLPSQSDLTNSDVGGPQFPTGTVYKDSNGFLKIK